VSNAERVDFQALAQLEAAIEQVTEELATWRRRAHKAESDRVDLSGDGDIVDARARIVDLEGENKDLRNRVQQTRRRVTELLTRLRFLEEQTATGEARR
jgi:predicted RNase H-like nuclease (RuvC/YqgF family)